MKQDWKKALPNESALFHEAMESALREVQTMKPVKRRIKQANALVFALIAVLLITGLALAASRSGILNVMFGEREPSKEAESLVRNAGQTAEADGMRLTLVDYLIDGDRLMISYEVESTREGTVFCTVASGSEAMPYSTTVDRDYSMMVLGGTADGHALAPIQQGMIRMNEMHGMLPSEPFDVTLVLRTGIPQGTLRIYPKTDPALDDWSGSWTDTDDKEMSEFQRDGEFPVYRHGTADFPKFYVDVNSGKGTMKLLSEAKYVEPLSELTVTITIDPKEHRAQPRVYLAEPVSFDVGAYTLEVSAVEITPTKMMAAASILPKQTREESGLSIEEYIQQLRVEYGLLDEEGKPIGEVYLSIGTNARLPDMKQMIDWTENADEWAKKQDDWYGPPQGFRPYYETGFPAGTFVYEGMSALPDTLVLAPILRGEDRRVSGYDMDRALYLPLKRIEVTRFPEPGVTYYTLPGSMLYHRDPNCSGMRDALEVDAGSIDFQRPCPVCLG